MDAAVAHGGTVLLLMHYTIPVHGGLPFLMINYLVYDPLAHLCACFPLLAAPLTK